MSFIEFTRQHEEDWSTRLRVINEEGSRDFVFEAIVKDEEGDDHSVVVIALSPTEAGELVSFLMSNGK